MEIIIEMSQIVLLQALDLIIGKLDFRLKLQTALSLSAQFFYFFISSMNVE